MGMFKLKMNRFSFLSFTGLFSFFIFGHPVNYDNVRAKEKLEF
jgi:hypothetical protein